MWAVNSYYFVFDPAETLLPGKINFVRTTSSVVHGFQEGMIQL